MRKNIIAFIALSVFSILLLTSLASAYGYNNYNDDSFSSTSYSKTSTSGSRYGPTSTTTTNYNKATDSVYLGYGGYAKTTRYTKTTTKSPDYYRYGTPGFGNTYSNLGNRYYYGSYYPKSSYNYDNSYNAYYPHDRDYNSWRYRPSYTYDSYGSGNRYGYDYYYKPRYIGHYNWRY